MPAGGWRRWPAGRGLLALLAAAGGALGGGAGAPPAGAADLASLVARLTEVQREMGSRHLTLGAVERVRGGLLTGERFELPSAQRQHLVRSSPLLGSVTYDVRHRPASANTSRHFHFLRTVAEGVVVRHYAFMPLKRSGVSNRGPAALLVVVDDASRLSVFDPDRVGGPLVGPLDLGHDGRKITNLVATSSQESHMLLSADEDGFVRVHSLRVIARRVNRTAQGLSDDPADDLEEYDDPEGEAPRRHLNVTANFSCVLSLSDSLSPGAGEGARLTTMLPVERGEKTYFAIGDSLGGVSVFFRNCTPKGRVRITDDPGGVRGLLKGHNQMVLYYSSHSFGTLSVTQVDVQAPPCTGWNSPVFDVVLDPSYQSSRVVLALADGEVILYSTMRGKARACDLSLKFPHISPIPFKLHLFRGHILALPTPLEDTPRRQDHIRDVYLFNLAAMDEGYSAGPSRAVTLQASFRPKQPDSLALTGAGWGSSAGARLQGERSRTVLAIRFEDAAGIDLFGVSLKPPPTPQAPIAGSGDEEDIVWYRGMMDWFPKLGVFAVALVGAVVWNVRKGRGGEDEFDEEFFHEQLRKAREQEERQSGGGPRSHASRASAAASRHGRHHDGD